MSCPVPQSNCHWDGMDLILLVRVQPRASREQIMGVQEGAIKVALTAPPVDGAANEALRRMLAKAIGVAASRVQVIQGERSRNKLVRILRPDRKSAEGFLRQIDLSTV
ncbi:MAG: DUF167 family protein [Magnetococcus sp. YQC-5]